MNLVDSPMKMQKYFFFCMPFKQERKIWFVLNMQTGNINLERLHSDYIDRILFYHLMPLISELLFFLNVMIKSFFLQHVDDHIIMADQTVIKKGEC